jgi:hypothetical protein
VPGKHHYGGRTRRSIDEEPDQCGYEQTKDGGKAEPDRQQERAPVTADDRRSFHFSILQD